MMPPQQLHPVPTGVQLEPLAVGMSHDAPPSLLGSWHLLAQPWPCASWVLAKP
ncbi:MAG: hypothetical protein JO021_09785 [Alphaproteobacteria bacterium]|nr:hypothetical protein [Alphaproteobacteria bacterium]